MTRNEIVTLSGEQLPARREALTPRDMAKLETFIEKHVEIKAKTVYRSTETGASFDVVGYDVKVKEGEAVPGALIEAVRRPTTSSHLNEHLTRLAAHKRQSKGARAHAIIVEDLAFDLEGVSEWAVAKAMIELRRSDSPFFPETPEIIATVKRWDAVARQFGEPAPVRIEKKKEEPWKPPTEEQKARVARLVELNAKRMAGGVLTEEEEKFMTGA